MSKEKTLNVQVRISSELHAFVRGEAERELMTISTWIRRALGKLMDEKKVQSKPAWHGGKGKRGKSAA